VTKGKIVTSKEYQEAAIKQGYGIRATLDDDDPRFRRTSLLMPSDESIFLISDSFLYEWCDEDGAEWILLLAKRHPSLAYPKSALIHYRQWGEEILIEEDF